MQQQANSLLPLEVLTNIRGQLQAKGSHTIRSLGRLLRSMDTFDGIDQVSFGEFVQGLSEIGIVASQEEFQVLHGLLDTKRTGNISIHEFLIGIRGVMNARRQAIVDKAFLKFDRECVGSIDPWLLRKDFNFEAHPQVQRREMSEEQAFANFLNNFAVDSQKKISRTQWNDYYSAVSSTIDNDDHFVQLMITAWKLNS